MKLKSWIENLLKLQFNLRLPWLFVSGNCGQNIPVRLNSFKSYMPFPFARRVLVRFCWVLFLAIPVCVFGQTNYYAADGTEYPVIGSLPGDQLFPDVALNASGGYVVWQDNITDGSGWGISAMQLNSTLSGSGSSFRVNVTGTNNQENAHVALLKNGGAAFVWQGGVEGVSQHIYAHFLNAGNVWLTSTDVLVSTFTKSFQVHPAVATLAGGDVIVVWSSYDQVASNSMMDVYGQLLSTNGKAIGTNFLINQFTSYNQREPAVSALANGGFVVTWVSEQELEAVPNLGNNTTYYMASSAPSPSADVYARLYTLSGTNALPSGSEFLVDTGTMPGSSPKVACAADGSYMITWCAQNVGDSSSWDVYERSYTNANGGPVYLVNSYTYGDQYLPRISVIGGDYLIIWTSLGQDGSREGVYGQFVHEGDSPVGNEFRVNTTTLGQQMQPAVAADGAEQFLAVWTSFTFTGNGFDLYAQRYVNAGAVLEPMGAPYVWAPFVLSGGVYQPELVVSWPPVQGLSISNYEVFVDGAATNMGTVTSNCWVMTAANGLTAASTHSFALKYVTSSGGISPISPSASGTTWNGFYWGTPPYAIPAEWMQEFFGLNEAAWPSATAPVTSGGPALWQIFETGGNPTNSASWLQTSLVKTPQGMFLNWNTQAGMTYQVQITTDFRSWSNVGAPRFEAGTTDSMYVGSGAVGYYRVQLLRQ